MLRIILVLGLVTAGVLLSLRSPFYALLFYVWNAYFRPEDWVWSPWNELVLALQISYWTGAFVVIVGLLSGHRLVLSFQALVFGLFAADTFLSSRAAEASWYSQSQWAEYAKTLVMTYFIPVLVNDTRRLRWLFLTMAFSLGFEGAKQGWVTFLLNPGGINENPIPFLGDNNGVAIGMLMLVPFFSTLARTAVKKKAARFYRFLQIGVVYRAITTYSRGGFLSAGALAFVEWLRSKKKLPMLVGIVLAGSLVLSVMPGEFWQRMDTITSYEEKQESSALGRLHFWSVAVEMARKNPLLGVGFLGYNDSYDKYDSSYGEFGKSRAVHSAWFGILAELGFPGLFLYVANLVLGLWSCGKVRRLAARSPSCEDLGKYAVAVETSLVVFAVGSSFLSFQYNEVYWHMIGISIALANIASARVRAPATESALQSAPRLEVAAA